MEIVEKNLEKIREIADKDETPFFLYDANSIKNTFRLLRNALPRSVDIFYSLKANPNIAIAAELREHGAHAEICSYYEMQAALKAGFKPDQIIFVGPAKSEKEIVSCINQNIYAIVCESINEFKRISEIAKIYNKKPNVALRINPSYVAKNALLKMGGKPSQFGMDEEIVFDNKDYFLKTEHIKLIGIHIYNGTRILDSETVVENTAYILDLARELQKGWDVTFQMVDIGGGLGVPYYDSEDQFDLNKFREKINPVISKYLSEYANTHIILESGRYLMAEAGVFVTKIVDIKSSKGEKFAITDGGTNCHLPAIGMGGFVKRNFPIRIIYQETLVKNPEIYTITGPLCTPGDIIAKKVLLPKLSIGDLVIVGQSGAYGPTASPIMFLSHGFPAEILIKNNKPYLIRDRFTDSDFFNKQYLCELFTQSHCNS